MTTSQLDHLRLLKAHLETLLANAKMRSPGEWEVDQSMTWDQSRGIHPQIVQRNAYLTAEHATYIASCAGNAEAGWRSTLKAIDLIEWLDDEGDDLDWRAAQKALESLLAEWPLETLKA